eukprot:GILI01027813.1.p1 GENE.GILI01027813.1~~GILI01027813.1.p1  ORF type:complete len:266 (+),score=82.26 GILI01027813.1:33-830(+)
MTRRIPLLLVALLLSSQLATAMDCSHSFLNNDDGTTVTYDLSPLTKTSGPDWKTTGQDRSGRAYKFLFNVCRETLASCNGESAIASQWSASGDCTAVIANAAPVPPTWALIDEDDASKGVKIMFDNGRVCGQIAGPRKTTLFFNCDHGVSETRVTGATEPTTCHYEISVNSPLACPVQPKGLSWGWTFNIILFSLLVVYVGGGVYWNWRKKQLKGLEALPHLDFWKEVPAYVKAGVVFTVDKVRFLLKSRRQGYEEVPAASFPNI